MNKPALAYDICHAAGMDAGNASARKRGLKHCFLYRFPIVKIKAAPKLWADLQSVPILSTVLVL